MFTDTLELKLELTCGETSVSVPGGNVKAWELDLHNWGFRARVVFLISLEKEDDPLFQAFITPDLLEVELRITAGIVPQGLSLEPLIVRGLATRKAMLDERVNEQQTVQQSRSLLYRLYEVEFADPAQVLWRWHRPFDLMVDKSVQDLLEAHKNNKITLQYAWDPELTQIWPVLCLGLGMDRGGASFYDFVLWYTRSHNGVFSYDPASDDYTLGKEKNNEGQAMALDHRWVESVRVEFPEPPRHILRGLNADATNPQQQEGTNPDGVEGLYYDYLDRFPVAADFEQRQELEQARLFTRSHELLLVFCQYPLLHYSTAGFIKLAGDLWDEELFTDDKEYRVRSIHMQAQAADWSIGSDRNDSFARFQMEMHSRLELREEKWVDLPTFTVPRYPVVVEGLVLSEQGEDADQTYQLYEDSETSRIQYKISIPLWDNQQVVAPFDPNMHSGHFYFPAYKKARALVALDFQSARIVQWLDWHDGARLPADTQGNRILMGWTPDNRTSISHTFANNLPVFAMERLADKDTESIIMSDGSLVIQTMEKKE